MQSGEKQQEATASSLQPAAGWRIRDCLELCSLKVTTNVHAAFVPLVLRIDVANQKLIKLGNQCGSVAHEREELIAELASLLACYARVLATTCRSTLST